MTERAMQQLHMDALNFEQAARGQLSRLLKSFGAAVTRTPVAAPAAATPQVQVFGGMAAAAAAVLFGPKKKALPAAKASTTWVKGFLTTPAKGVLTLFTEYGGVGALVAVEAAPKLYRMISNKSKPKALPAPAPAESFALVHYVRTPDGRAGPVILLLLVVLLGLLLILAILKRRETAAEASPPSTPLKVPKGFPVEVSPSSILAKLPSITETTGEPASSAPSSPVADESVASSVVSPETTKARPSQEGQPSPSVDEARNMWRERETAERSMRGSILLHMPAGDVAGNESYQHDHHLSTIRRNSMISASGRNIDLRTSRRSLSFRPSTDSAGEGDVESSSSVDGTGPSTIEGEGKHSPKTEALLTYTRESQLAWMVEEEARVMVEDRSNTVSRTNTAPSVQPTPEATPPVSVAASAEVSPEAHPTDDEEEMVLTAISEERLSPALGRSSRDSDDNAHEEVVVDNAHEDEDEDARLDEADSALAASIAASAIESSLRQALTPSPNPREPASPSPHPREPPSPPPRSTRDPEQPPSPPPRTREPPTPPLIVNEPMTALDLDVGGRRMTPPPIVNASEPEPPEPPTIIEPTPTLILDVGGRRITPPPILEASEPEPALPVLDFGGRRMTPPPILDTIEPEPTPTPILDFGGRRMTPPPILDVASIANEEEEEASTPPGTPETVLPQRLSNAIAEARPISDAPAAAVPVRASLSPIPYARRPSLSAGPSFHDDDIEDYEPPVAALSLASAIIAAAESLPAEPPSGMGGRLSSSSSASGRAASRQASRAKLQRRSSEAALLLKKTARGVMAVRRLLPRKSSASRMAME